MDGSGEPRIIAEVGAAVIAEDGPCVLVIDRGTSPATVLAFVLGIIAVCTGGFGAVTLVLSIASPGSSPSAIVAVVFLIVGLAFGGATFAVLRAIRRRRAKSLQTYRPVAVFDRARRVYFDGGGNALAPLDHVAFQRSMQLTSSSPKLVAVTPNGTRVLVRGNPFSGGIGNLDAVLTHAVFGVART